MPEAKWCATCADPERKRIVDNALRQVRSPNYIEKHWQELGLKSPIKMESVQRHRAHSASDLQPVLGLAKVIRQKRAERAEFVASVLETSSSGSPEVSSAVTESSLPSHVESVGNPVTPLSATPSPNYRDPDDIATLVREQAAEKLRNGELRVTTQHALQAQQILDKREEKAKDRDLIIAFGRLMTSVNVPARVLPRLPAPPTTEGEYEDVSE